MRIAFLYNRATEDPSNTADDDRPEHSPVVAALRRLGHTLEPIACTLDLASVRSEILRAQPDVVFNRVESLGGSDAMIAAVTLLLDSLQIPYTGCPTYALVATANKLAVKERLVGAGLPTPEWIASNSEFRIADCRLDSGSANSQSAIGNSKFILKSVSEHASFELDDTSVVGPLDDAEIRRLLCERAIETGREFFAERFVEGREFNLSILGNEPRVLPPAEIDFSAFPAGKPRIVGSAAKWNRTAFEFHNTPRQFDFPPRDLPLLKKLSELATQCWRLFGLRGYARVDFRCDEAGQPWILEINSNPCLAPKSGFAAALVQAGIRYDEGIQLVVDAALPALEQRKISSEASRALARR